MVWGELAALSVMFTVADRAPALAGVKTTLTLHDAPAATVAPQLSVSAKLDASAPVIVIFTPLRSAFPLFFSEILWAAEAVAIAWVAKVRLVGAMVTTGAVGGSAAEIVKGSAAETPPPLPGFITVTWVVPMVAMSEA